MAIKVDDSLIKKLEKLSRIALSKDEEESLKNDLNTILEYMSILDEADVSGVREMYSPQVMSYRPFCMMTFPRSLKDQKISLNSSLGKGEIFWLFHQFRTDEQLGCSV